jgi:hypothetical protein
MSVEAISAHAAGVALVLWWALQQYTNETVYGGVCQGHDQSLAEAGLFGIDQRSGASPAVWMSISKNVLLASFQWLAHHKTRHAIASHIQTTRHQWNHALSDLFVAARHPKIWSKWCPWSPSVQPFNLDKITWILEQATQPCCIYGNVSFTALGVPY